jgi:hypothetical protein
MLLLLEIAFVEHRRPVIGRRISGGPKEGIGRFDGICRSDAQRRAAESAQSLNRASLLICGVAAGRRVGGRRDPGAEGRLQGGGQGAPGLPSHAGFLPGPRAAQILRGCQIQWTATAPAQTISPMATASPVMLILIQALRSRAGAR